MGLRLGTALVALLAAPMLAQGREPTDPQALLRDGRYAAAARLAQELLAARGDRMDLAAARLLDARAEGLRRSNAADPAARTVAEQALELKRSLGAGPAELAVSLHNLGALELVCGNV